MKKTGVAERFHGEKEMRRFEKVKNEKRLRGERSIEHRREWEAILGGLDDGKNQKLTPLL